MSKKNEKLRDVPALKAHLKCTMISLITTTQIFFERMQILACIHGLIIASAVLSYYGT